MVSAMSGKRGEAAVAEVGGVVVDQFVEQPHRQVGHADLVGVREAERQACLRRVPILPARVVLARQVLGRFGYGIEQVLEVRTVVGADTGWDGGIKIDLAKATQGL